MKRNTKTPARCPACSCKRLNRHTDPNTDFAFWRCESCGQAYSDAAGTVGDRLPLTLHQAAGIVAIAQKHPTLFGIKNALEKQGMDSSWSMTLLKQAVEEDFLNGDTGSFISTEKGKAITDMYARPCPTCGESVLFYDTPQTGTFWKCVSCKTTFADDDNKPAAPHVCEKCGGKSLTRYAAANRPEYFFWGCGACRRIFEDVDGSAGRCFDDINE